MPSELKNGPLPADIKDTIMTILREEGVKNVTVKILRTRLENKYAMDFVPHKDAIDVITTELMQRPEFKKQLETVLKENDAFTSGRGRVSKRDRGAEKGVKAKKAKPEKPKDYPKMRRSAYILFSSDQRDELKAKHPDLSNKDIISMMGKMWKELGDDVRERYERMAEEDKVRFEREMKEYKKRGGTEYRRSGKVKKDPNMPKKGMTAFFHFLREYRAEHGDIGMLDMTKAAGAAWRELKPEQRKKYDEMAKRDKERYTSAMEKLQQ